MHVEEYAFGRISVDGRIYASDVIIAPDKVTDGWWRKEGHSLHIEDLKEVVAARPQLLIIGTGFYGRMNVPAQTREYLEAQGIEVRAAKTGEAVMEFNLLQKEYARIVAALHLTC